MEALFLVCAESLALDQRRNTLSLFHVIEEWNIPAFPLAVPYMVIVGLLKRTAEEPEAPEGVQLRITLANQEIFLGPISVNFQGRLRMRSITELGGLVILNPGVLSVSIIEGVRQLATWSVVVNHIGRPEAQAELPLGPS
jgi:hypothetical protein